MSSKAALLMSASLLLCANAAGAANYLTNAQMDNVTAGQILGLECPGCTLASSTSTSANGITSSTSTTGTSGGGGGGAGSGGGGPGGGPTGPSVLTPVQLPASLTAILAAATVIH